MSRITKIEGDFMGVRFEVKPTPINIDEVIDGVRDTLKEWYKENEPEVYKKMDGNKLDLDITGEEDDGELERISKLIDSLNAWKKDEEFRAEYLKKMANACMDFKKQPQDEVWARPDIEYSTIREAWDFFCERRSVPIS